MPHPVDSTSAEARAATHPGPASSAQGSTDWGRSSTIFDLPARAERPPVSAFDVCNGGVVLRAVLFVHGVLAVAAAFAADGWSAWLVDIATASGVALPAVLAWLVVACVGQRWLARMPAAAQWAAAVALGALCATGAWAFWVALDLTPRVPLGMLAPALAGGSLAAAMFFWLRLRASMQLPATTKARLAELQSRIRPHFLFNTLNSAIALVRVDPERAEEVLEDLSELFRAALTESGRRVTLGEEVQLARRYLAIEQVRFGERLQVLWELDSGASSAEVPPLMLQPLVENAVKHGIEPASEGGVIRIRTRVKGGQVVVLVTNTLSDQPSQPGHGIALRNLRERLRLLHDIAADFEAGPVKGEQGSEYRVRFTVPMPN